MNYSIRKNMWFLLLKNRCKTTFRFFSFLFILMIVVVICVMQIMFLIKMEYQQCVSELKCVFIWNQNTNSETADVIKANNMPAFDSVASTCLGCLCVTCCIFFFCCCCQKLNTCCFEKKKLHLWNAISQTVNAVNESTCKVR